MKTLLVFIVGIVLGACGGLGDGSTVPSGQLMTLACVNGTATQAFPGQRSFAIDVNVWVVVPDPRGVACPTPTMMSPALADACLLALHGTTTLLADGEILVRDGSITVTQCNGPIQLYVEPFPAPSACTGCAGGSAS